MRLSWPHMRVCWPHLRLCWPMWAYLRLMLGLCWAYLDPFLAYIGPDQEFWPLLKNMQKHRILEQNLTLTLISYNAIANGSRRHTRNASAPSVRADLCMMQNSWLWFYLPPKFPYAAPRAVARIHWVLRFSRNWRSNGGFLKWGYPKKDGL